MHAIDRRLLQLWTAVTVGAGCAIYLALLVALLILSIIGMPLAVLLGIFRRTPKDWTRLTRRTEVQYARIAAPLWLVPGFCFDTVSPTLEVARSAHRRQPDRVLSSHQMERNHSQ